MKYIKWLLLIPAAVADYFIIALVLTFITVNNSEVQDRNELIFLSTNGNHLYLVLQIGDLCGDILDGIGYDNYDRYMSFGWGEENFYLNTPTWDDLTIKNAFTALFFITPSLINVAAHSYREKHWIDISLSSEELARMNEFIATTFKNDESGGKIKLESDFYPRTEMFYKAKGKYTLFNTCNTWVNSALKYSGLKACLWTPFEFGPRRIYE